MERGKINDIYLFLTSTLKSAALGTSAYRKRVKNFKDRSDTTT